MTINLAIQEHGKNRTVPVKAYSPFEMYGYKFAAHKAYSDNTWNVSEFTTGFSVCRNNYTRAKALEKAKERLEAIGEVKVIEAIEYAKSFLKAA
jgi:hypothetical protein